MTTRATNIKMSPYSTMLWPDCCSVLFAKGDLLPESARTAGSPSVVIVRHIGVVAKRLRRFFQERSQFSFGGVNRRSLDKPGSTHRIDLTDGRRDPWGVLLFRGGDHQMIEEACLAIERLSQS